MKRSMQKTGCLVVVGLVVMLLACSESSENMPTGDVGQWCYWDQTCKDGLTCTEQNICIDPNAPDNPTDGDGDGFQPSDGDNPDQPESCSGTCTIQSEAARSYCIGDNLCICAQNRWQFVSCSEMCEREDQRSSGCGAVETAAYPYCQCVSSPSDGDTPDGDTPDGDVPDGDTPDGDTPDGDMPDGDVPDGDEPEVSCSRSSDCPVFEVCGPGGICIEKCTDTSCTAPSECNPDNGFCEFCGPLSGQVCPESQCCNYAPQTGIWYCGNCCVPPCAEGYACGAGVCYPLACPTCEATQYCSADTGYTCQDESCNGMCGSDQDNCSCKSTCFEDGNCCVDMCAQCGSYAPSQTSWACYDNDVYWYDACGTRRDKKQDCGFLECLESGNGCGYRPPNWIPIPGGTIWMGGRLSDNSCDSDEYPMHEVTVPAFEMTETEITQALYEVEMGTNPSHFDDCPGCPVHSISLQKASEFCAAIGGRLPTEAEWEYAARAGQNHIYQCGDSSSCLDSSSWYNDNSGGSPKTVAQKDPNAFGLYDMTGNVWEWTSDCYHSTYDGAPRNGSAWVDDCDASAVARGGSYASSNDGMRLSERAGLYPPSPTSLIYYGIRCVR